MPMNEPPPAYSAFDDPTTYRIVVHGFLSCALSDRLKGMEINQTIGDDGAWMSILVGELVNQAALADVLITLYDLQMHLIAVEQIPPAGLSDHFTPDDSET